jgi:hypothetical protein
MLQSGSSYGTVSISDYRLAFTYRCLPLENDGEGKNKGRGEIGGDEVNIL